MKPAPLLWKALATCSLVSMLTACGTGPSASALRGAIDASATTACGKTPLDTLKIERTTESGYRAGLWPRPAPVSCK